MRAKVTFQTTRSVHANNSSVCCVSGKENLKPYTFERRNPGPHDVAIDILYCGVCHSDLHQVRDEWGGSEIPDGAGSRDRRQSHPSRIRSHKSQSRRFRRSGLHGRLVPKVRFVWGKS